MKRNSFWCKSVFFYEPQGTNPEIHIQFIFISKVLFPAFPFFHYVTISFQFIVLWFPKSCHALNYPCLSSFKFSICRCFYFVMNIHLLFSFSYISRFSRMQFSGSKKLLLILVSLDITTFYTIKIIRDLIRVPESPPTLEWLSNLLEKLWKGLFNNMKLSCIKL